MLYDRSYSSIYGEWETGEARRMNRTFHESVRFPAPDAEFDLVISKRGEDNAFEEIWRIRLDPDDYLVHRESAAYLDRVIAIERNGDPREGRSLPRRRLYGGRARCVHRTRAGTDRGVVRDLTVRSGAAFQRLGARSAAAESGVSRPSTGIYRDTPFGASYECSAASATS